MSGMKVKELMDSLKGDCYRFRVHYPEEWEFGLITGATFFGKRGLVLQHGEDDVSSFTLNRWKHAAQPDDNIWDNELK